MASVDLASFSSVDFVTTIASLIKCLCMVLESYHEHKTHQISFGIPKTWKMETNEKQNLQVLNPIIGPRIGF